MSRAEKLRAIKQVLQNRGVKEEKLQTIERMADIAQNIDNGVFRTASFESK